MRSRQVKRIPAPFSARKGEPGALHRACRRVVAAEAPGSEVEAGRFLDALLFEVAPHDPMSVAAAGSAVAAIAVLSSYVTARRAARIDPLVALRDE